MKDALLQVADVAHRRRIPARAIRQLANRIAERFAPRRIILFGSYARGTPRPESDVDLLILLPEANDGDASLRIRQAVPCNFGLDLVVLTPETFERRLALGDFFLKRVAKEGKVLYGSADR